MGEKRKSRMTNTERASKKEKKTLKSVVSSASNDDIEEQSSMHSNSSTSDSTSQQPSIIQEINHTEEIEESQTITPIDVENETNEDQLESSSLINTDNKISIEPTKSWWSSLIRLFHFGNNTANENKNQIEDHQSSTCLDGSYLSNIKCRRSLHGDSFIG
ncbi:unnamed protein product [Adineta steineri]|uniref:Uncharacterized protein n=1 Tax=Adineta steineri TaxID=433720 RepID=A0A813Y2P0_9BILA|nr:unnamed protein product [Adineta steineri]